MGLEYVIEQGLKAAFAVVTDVLDVTPDQIPVYRTFFGDDEPDEEDEKRKMPCVLIMSAPSVPDGYQSIFHDTDVRIEIATYDAPEHDPKGAIIRAIYEAIRAVVDADSWTLSGYAKKSTMIESTSSDFDGAYRLVGIDLKVNSCA